MGAAGAQALVAAVLSVLQTYYSGPGASLVRGTSVADYAYASVYNVSHATGYYYTSRIMVMVQQTSSDAGWVALLTGTTSAVPSRCSGCVVSLMTDTAYQTASASVAVSRPQACGDRQTPSAPTADQCVCAAGAHVSTPWPSLTCTPCPSLTYSDVPNTNYVCTSCPIGWGTGGATGATNCTVPTTSSQAATSSGLGTPAIIGIAAGGVVLVGCLIAAALCLTKSDTKAYDAVPAAPPPRSKTSKK